MISKIATFLTIVTVLMGAMLLYAQAAYFPMDRGVKVEEKVLTLEKSLDFKLDRILKAVEQ